jgi:hypothetical protein
MTQLTESGRGDAVAGSDSIRHHRALQIALGHWRSGETGRSTRWKSWSALMTSSTCAACRALLGTIYDMDEKPPAGPPLHPNCRCILEALPFIEAGYATGRGEAGADYQVLVHGELPDYYISKEEARRLGWDSKKGNLAEVLPGRMIGGDVFRNGEGKLPDAPGRVWYEADVDYTGGYRNGKRILFSNDGLIFFTDTHYLTFTEIGL